MRELAYIQTIKSLSPIPDADAIEKAEVLGWELVVKKGDFKVGDTCVYVEIDSILPQLPAFEFLRSKKFRVKTVKLRGQVSQGIAFPLSVIKEVDPSVNISSLKVGQDITEILKITKHDPEAALETIPEQEKKSWVSNKLSYLKWKLFGYKPVRRGSFPSDIPKTEEIRVQKMGGALMHHEGQDAYISEKLEGQSCTFVFRKEGNWLSKLFANNTNFQVCSRNTIIYNSRSGKKQSHHLITVAEKYDLHNVLKKLGRNIAIQGEAVGGKIQGNIYKLPELDFYVFGIYDLDKKEYIHYLEMIALCSDLGLKTVPIVYMQKIVADVPYYVELSKGTSMINPKIMREGIVVRTCEGNLSFKSINPNYLLKQE